MRWFPESGQPAKSRIAAVVLLGCVTFRAVGQVGDIQCSSPQKQLEHVQVFAELQARALELNQDACLLLHGNVSGKLDARLRQRYREFGLDARATAFAAFQDLPVENLDDPFDHFVERLSERLLEPGQLPELNVHLSDLADEWLVFHFDNPVRAGHIASAADDQACRSRLGLNCSEALDDLATALNSYKVEMESRRAARTVDSLDRAALEWDEFLAEGRSQTPLDLLLTTRLERRHLRRGHLAGPPKRQWSVLHPGLVFERAPDALPGEQNQMSVAVEWLGVNWWSEESPLFGVPFGVALTTVFSDRRDQSAAGHGIALHFGNRYSVGWSSRDGSGSYFLSIDLLKLVDDRQDRLDRYRQRLRRSQAGAEQAVNRR